jgi:hypothetical protein
MEIPSPFSLEGSVPRAHIFEERLQECIAANNLTFPILAVYCPASGPVVAQLYREAGKPETLAEWPDRVGKPYPVRALYVELSTGRPFQWTLTKPLWGKLYRSASGYQPVQAAWRSL